MDTGIARSEQVYEHLKNLILSRALKPGEKIPEAKLAAQFGLSRTPIREAIKKLANDGIVTLYPNRFAEVSVLPQNWLQEVGMVRLSLDIVAAHLAILYGSNYDYSIMQKLNEECHEATLAGDVATRIEKNCAFHLDLSRLYLKLEFVQACNYDNVESTEGQYRQHCQMIQALYNRNESMLINILSDHLKKFHNLGDMTPIMGSIQGIFKA